MGQVICVRMFANSGHRKNPGNGDRDDKGLNYASGKCQFREFCDERTNKLIIVL
jgi:hypothetical protein